MELILTDDKLYAEITEKELIFFKELRLLIKPNQTKLQGQMVSLSTASNPTSLSFYHYCFNCSIVFYLKKLSRKVGEFHYQNLFTKRKGTRKIQTEDLHSATVFFKFSHQFYKPEYISGVLKTRRYPKTRSVLSETARPLMQSKHSKQRWH